MADQKNLLLSPVLKRVDGKQQLLSKIIPMIPSSYSTYIESFIDGGAMLSELRPKKAIINDYSSELVNVYTVIKDYPEGLIKELQFHKDSNTSEHFYVAREYDRKTEFFSQITDVQKAARIIYLNKARYNGLYRVNSAGQFSSPYGKYKNPNIVNKHVIRAMSKHFNDNAITIKNGDYKEVLKELRKDAIVYLDPPYIPISTSPSFTEYTESGFNVDRQRELGEECDKLGKRGIKFLQSGSDCESVRGLCKDYNIRIIKARRSMNNKGNSRGEINKVLIYNYGQE